MGLIGDLFTPSKKDGKTVININNKQLTKSISSSMSKESSKMTTTVSSLQSMSLKNLKFTNCTPIISQTSNIQVKSVQSISSTSAKNMQQDISDQLKSSLEAESKKENGFLSTGGGPKGDVITNVSAEIEKVVQTEMSETKMNDILTAINAGQDLKIEGNIVDMCPPVSRDVYPFLTGQQIIQLNKDTISACKDNTGKFPACPIEQAMQITVLTEQLVKNISNSAAMTIALSKLDNYANAASISKNQGLGESIGDVSRGVGDAVSTAATGAGTGVSTAATGVGEGVGTAAKGVGEGIGTAAEGVGTGVGSVFSGMGTGIWIFIFMLIAAAVALYYFTTKE